MQGGFPKQLIMTYTDLMDSVIRVFLVYFVIVDLLILKSCQTKMGEFLLLNHSQEIYRSKTVAKGEDSQLLKWLINIQK